MHAFGVPGMAAAIVRDGKVVHSKGYGVREIGKPEPVTPQTVFAIASCTKAFTATATAMLVDEGKMAWDDPVRKHIPFFRLSDPNSDHLVTIADLLSHRTGLPRNDALWYGSSCSREEILRRAGRLETKHTIRSHYEYNNLMYTAAGFALGLASGLGYEGFIRRRIFRPLGMQRAVLTASEAQAFSDHATPHLTDKNWVPVVIPWRVIDHVCPTGGISASVEDLGKWVRFQLNDGAWKGKRLVTAANLAVTRTPAIISALADEPGLPSVSAYAMGWDVSDQMGVKVLAHSGGIDGFSSQTVLLPRQNAGFVILSNSDRPGAAAVQRSLIAYLGGFQPVKDPLERTIDEEKKAVEERKKASTELLAKRVDGTKPSMPTEAFAGRYADPAYGEFEAEVQNGDLTMDFNGIRFSCEHFHYDTFLLHAPWPQAVECPGTVTFEIGLDGSPSSVHWVDSQWGIDRKFKRVG